ncbi:MAG: chromate transporter [Candidatus Binataceae bacterium]
MNDASVSDLGAAQAAPAKRPSLANIFKVFLMAGAISFGGGVVAYQREYLVRGEQWMTDEDFLDALAVSQTLPGLNSVNLSVVAGDRLRGIPGALAALAGIMLPGVLVVMTLGVLWEGGKHNPYATAFLIGIAAAAVGLLTTVTLQLGHRQFAQFPDIAILLITFIAVSFFHVSLILVLLIIGPIAVFIYRPGSHHHEKELKLPHPRFHIRRGLLRH